MPSSEEILKSIHDAVVAYDEEGVQESRNTVHRRRP